MDNTRVIDLKFNREVFERHFKVEEHGSILKNKRLSIRLFFILAVSLALAYCAFVSLQSDGLIVWTVMLAVVLILLVVLFLADYFQVIKWKRSVFAYITSVQKHQRHELTLTDKGFLFIQDDVEYFEGWQNISGYKSGTDYIQINAKEEYLFPKESMRAEDFEYLGAFLSKGIKNSL